MSEHPKVTWQLPDEEVEWEELESQWENSTDGFADLVKRGKEGLNIGMANGLNALNKYIGGTHQGRYILIGADSGCFKTTILDFMYIYSLWKDCKLKDVKLYIKYFSFELPTAEKKAKWASQWIKLMYNIDLPSEYITGRQGVPIAEHYKLIKRAFAVINELMLDVTMVDHMLHPTGMLNVLVEEHYEKIGTVVRAPAKEGKSKGMILKYIPKDPLAMTICVVDHISLINHEGAAATTKASIDKWSMYSVQLRNIFRCTIINLQQFSTDLMSAYREQKKSEAAIAPSRLDFSESKFCYRDADIVLGLVKPIQFNLKTYHGYNLEDIGQYFVAMHLMKNRYGPSDRVLPLFVNPISGMFYDIPAPTSYGVDGQPSINYFITEAKRIESVCQQFSSQPGTPQ